MISLPQDRPPPSFLANLHRLLTAPLVAAMTVVACGIAAALNGVTGQEPLLVFGIFAAGALGGAVCGAATGGRPAAANVISVALAATGTAGLLLWILGGPAGGGDPLAGDFSRGALLPFLFVLLLACFGAAAAGIWLRRRFGGSATPR